MGAHEAAQPGVLKLLLAPQVGNRLGLVAERRSALGDRRVHVEEGAVGIEDAGIDLVEGRLGHGLGLIRFGMCLSKPVAPGKATVLARAAVRHNLGTTLIRPDLICAS
jgi:hypothetical protein